MMTTWSYHLTRFLWCFLRAQQYSVLLIPFCSTLLCPSQVSAVERRGTMIWEVAVLLSLTLGAGAVLEDDPEDGGKHWVVIVAGSNGWFNYRHQVRK